MTIDPIKPRDALIDAGRRRLVTHGIDALRFTVRFKTTNDVWASNEVKKSYANGASCA